jgi:hypothetical protein
VTKTKFRVKGPAGQRRSREIPIGKVRQTYKDYRFYRVWSTQQVHDHVLGRDAALARSLPVRATPEAAAPEEKTVADDADWPETGPLPPGIAYEESFDWSMDNEEAVREWEDKGWQIGFDGKGIWTGEVSDGVYRLSNRRYESELYTQTLSFGEDSGDAPIAARVTLERIDRPGRPAAGLLYRYTPGRVPLYYAYVLTYDGNVELRRRTERGFKRLYRAPVDGFEWGRSHELRIAGSGDSFELWLDGELLTVVSDEELRGLPGIFASGRGRYVFDDVTLFFP